MKVSVLAVALAGVAGFSPFAFAQDIPSLVSTWKGKADGVSMERGYMNDDVTVVIEEQRGRSFKGKVTYPVRGGTKSEPLLGTIAPDGRTVYLAGDDGVHLGSIPSAGVLDLCYLEASEDDAMAVCSRLIKQP